MPTKTDPDTGAPQLVALKSKKNTKQETVTLFSINGKAYDVPINVPPNKSLQIMHVIRMQGETAGVSFMLETMLGTDGYNALLNFDDLSEEDLETIVKAAFELVQASVDKAKN